MNRIFVTIVLLAITGFACKKETPAPPVQTEAQNVQTAPLQTALAPQTLPEQKKIESETYLYTPQGRRDPFLSIIEAAKRERETERKKKKVRPVEAYDAADINVIAIAQDKEEYYAMVQLPDKKYFTVKTGMTLGLYGGKVTRITAQGIILREYVKNYKGELQPRDTILRLRKEGEE